MALWFFGHMLSLHCLGVCFSDEGSNDKTLYCIEEIHLIGLLLWYSSGSRDGLSTVSYLTLRLGVLVELDKYTPDSYRHPGGILRVPQPPELSGRGCHRRIVSNATEPPRGYRGTIHMIR